MRWALFRSVLARLLLTLGLWSVFGVARADGLSELEKAYGAYAAHKYADAEARLRALLDPKATALKDPDSVADARMYLAATLIAEGKTQEAGAVLEQLLLERQQYHADPLRVPLEALDALEDVRARLTSKLSEIAAERVKRLEEEKARAEAEKERAAARLAKLERLASEETVIERHSRLLAMVPFGVGQFQNRQYPLAWTLLVGEGLLAAGSAIAAELTVFNEANANDALARGQGSIAMGYHDRAKADWITGDVFAACLIGAAVAGVVQAQLAFVPEQFIQVRRRRSVPASKPPAEGISLVPQIGPAGLGLAGRF